MTLLSTGGGPGGAEAQRKIVLAVVESDCNDYGLEEKTSLGFDATGMGKTSKKGSQSSDAMDMDVDSDNENTENKEETGEDIEEEDEEEKEARATPIRGPILCTPGRPY
jgi:hypothetical protein